MIPRNLWKVSRNWDVAGQGWSHLTRGTSLTFVLPLVTISICKNLRDQSIPSEATDDQRKLECNWTRAFCSAN